MSGRWLQLSLRPRVHFFFAAAAAIDVTWLNVFHLIFLQRVQHSNVRAGSVLHTEQLHSIKDLCSHTIKLIHVLVVWQTGEALQLDRTVIMKTSQTCHHVWGLFTPAALGCHLCRATLSFHCHSDFHKVNSGVNVLHSEYANVLLVK